MPLSRCGPAPRRTSMPSTLPRICVLHREAASIEFIGKPLWKGTHPLVRQNPAQQGHDATAHRLCRSRCCCSNGHSTLPLHHFGRLAVLAATDDIDCCGTAQEREQLRGDLAEAEAQAADVTAAASQEAGAVAAAAAAARQELAAAHSAARCGISSCPSVWHCRASRGCGRPACLDRGNPEAFLVLPGSGHPACAQFRDGTDGSRFAAQGMMLAMGRAGADAAAGVEARAAGAEARASQLAEQLSAAGAFSPLPPSSSIDMEQLFAPLLAKPRLSGARLPGMTRLQQHVCSRPGSLRSSRCLSASATRHRPPIEAMTSRVLFYW